MDAALREPCRDEAEAALLERFRAAAERRGAYDRRDPEPCDISILPRIVTSAEAGRLADISVRIVRAALDWTVDRHADGGLARHAHGGLARHADGGRAAAGQHGVAGYGLDWVADEVGRLPDELVGNVRLDFLVSAGQPWLLEMGWVNLSGFDYAPQAALALLDVRPELHVGHHVQRPVEPLRRRLLDRGVQRLAILVKEEHTPYAANDFRLIAEAIRPIDTIVVAEPEFPAITADKHGLRVGEVAVDAVYLRALDGPAAFEGRHAATNLRTLRLLLAADVVFHDHPLMLLAEDKDLRFLIDRDPSLAKCVPEVRRPAEVEPADAGNWVLKLRDRHSGTGVFLDEPAMRARWDDPDAILQRRIEADRIDVSTVHGRRGRAVADLAVHVSYRYAVARRELLVAEVAGYFSRFALDGGIVNLCAGGGILPVLAERDS